MASRLLEVFHGRKKRDLRREYSVKGEIGRGASSVVYEAVHRASGESVAIKTISKATLRTDIKKLYSEVEIMNRLRHENIIRLHEVFDSPKEIHLVMDLVRGGELFDKIIQRGQYSEADAAVLVAQILNAVSYMHSHGICHRDLKPENLLCAEEQELYIRIADFGLSKAFSGNDMVTICGTPDYVAPEVIECKPYTEGVDLWSVGVITYTLLCGFTPFYGQTHRELFQKILSIDYDFPDPEWSAISQEAKDFIRRLLVVDSHRPTAAQALRHPWLAQNLRGTAPLALAQKNLASKNGCRTQQRTPNAAGVGQPLSSPKVSPPVLQLQTTAGVAVAVAPPPSQGQQRPPPPLPVLKGPSPPTETAASAPRMTPRSSLQQSGSSPSPSSSGQGGTTSSSEDVGDLDAGEKKKKGHRHHHHHHHHHHHRSPQQRSPLTAHEQSPPAPTVVVAVAAPPSSIPPSSVGSPSVVRRLSM